MNGGMVKESPPYDFLIIFNATSCKMILECDFPFTFDLLTKLTGLWEIMSTFFTKKLP